MGALRKHNLQVYISSYGLTNFIETGTWDGTGGARYASTFNFENMYSCEIDVVKYNEAIKNLSDVKIQLFNESSKEFLNHLLPLEGNTLFWLDAHYPEIETVVGNEEYQDKYDYDTRLPLESELRLIMDKQDVSNSVFIIDDLRCYITGPFAASNFNKDYFKDLGHGHDGGIDFVYELLGETHDIKKDYRDQGYLIITPKEKGNG